MSTEEEKVKAKVDAAEATVKAEETSLINRVKPHLVAIAFVIGGLLGFIAGHIR